MTQLAIALSTAAPDDAAYPRQIAVLTGDIVGSTALGAEKLERAISALEDCAEMQAEWMGESLHFTRHRGDGWQVALAEPKYALRSALAFRAALRAEGSEFDSYIGIAVGQLGAPLSENLNTQTTKVFEVSGRSLETAKTQASYFLHGNGGMADAATIACEWISRGWSQAQSQAILYALHPDHDVNFTRISTALGKSRQAVTKALNSAGVEPLRMTLRQFESDEPHV